jgi:ATP-binding cassette subfamily B (MDR/TAP) protein 1
MADIEADGNRINQGIAEKLYTAVVGISLFFSSYIVALAVQWKLALITMSIIPANILIMGFCVRSDAPLEARIVSVL